MQTAQIQNTAGVWGQTAVANDQLVSEYLTSAAVAAGDVVVTAVAGTCGPTTTANNKLVIGVVGPQSIGSLVADATAYASGVVAPVIKFGTARINIGANTVAAGDILATSTTTKVAVTNNAATVGQAIAIALEADSAKDANNAIRALICKM